MWGAGFATGIGGGFALGLIVGRLGVKQKPWSEMTEKEKKTRKIVIGCRIFSSASGDCCSCLGSTIEMIEFQLFKEIG